MEHEDGDGASLGSAYGEPGALCLLHVPSGH